MTELATTDLRDRTYHWRAASDDLGDGLTMEGYAAVFDSPTIIDDWDGMYEETIARGAFQRTLKARGDRVLLMYNHGRHPLFGDYLIGRIEDLHEDSHGLYVKARLHDNWLVSPIRDAIASGAISEMSFRFRPVKDKVEVPEDGGMTKITRLEVMLIELGPVNLGAFEETEVSVREWACRGASLLAGHPVSLVPESTSVSTGDTAPSAPEPDETVTGPASGDPSEPATRSHDDTAGRATRHQLRRLALALRGTPE